MASETAFYFLKVQLGVKREYVNTYMYNLENELYQEQREYLRVLRNKGYLLSFPLQHVSQKSFQKSMS